MDWIRKLFAPKEKEDGSKAAWNKADFEAFVSEYEREEKEILVLTSDEPSAAMKLRDSWSPCRYFLAYMDLASNEVKIGDGRITWLISEEIRQKYGNAWPHYFKGGVIYQLRVRELMDKTVPEGRLPAYYNRFMVVEVLDSNVHNEELLDVLAEYRTPVKLSDETLGEFLLNKDLRFFAGNIHWLGEPVSADMEVIIDNKDTWAQALDVLRTLFEQQEQRDSEFRAFAAKALIETANEWRSQEESEDTPEELSEEEFMGRISLSSLAVTPDGKYTAYYDDDNMFWGHSISVEGSIETGPESASI
ncbi:MAG: DUF2262 domain-containing protein [Oscillospiraceae bacterium]|nr:DUF2262 domain-containing protein [Oscillospiraceae bacterium]